MLEFCTSCFSAKKDAERDPLLPKNPPPPKPASLPSDSVLNKLASVIVSLNEGKLPSQDQINHALRVILKSDFLREDTESKMLKGNGPTSKQGRKVLADAREVVQAILQIGLEKNDDDKLQDLLYQISQIEGASVNVEASGPGDATKTILSNVQDQAPSQDEILSDASVLIRALKSLFYTFLTSSPFRLLLSDLLSIFREIVVHVAVDVENAALQVHDAAESVQQKALNNEFDLSKGNDNIGSVVEGFKEKGKEAVDKAVGGVHDVRKEWEGVGDDLSNKTKDIMIERLQEVITRAQQNPRTKDGFNSILLILRKYANKLSAASTIATEQASEFVNNVPDVFYSANVGLPSTYPPQPYGRNNPEDQKQSGSSSINVELSSSLSTALNSIQDLLERLAGGHPLSPMLQAFETVARDIGSVPQEVVDEVERNEKENGSEKPEALFKETQAHKSFKGKSKGKKKAAKRAATKVHDEHQISQDHEEESASSISEDPNPFHAYFSSVGKYLDKALVKPGWVTSRSGTHALGKLYDAGVDLVNIVVGVAVEIGEGAAEADVDLQNGTDDKENGTARQKGTKRRGANLRRKFGSDLQYLLNEYEAFIHAIQEDKTTMRLVGTLEACSMDFKSLIEGRAEGGNQKTRYGRQRKEGRSNGLLNMGGTWTQWLGWGLPKLIKMIPIGMMPIPRVEVKKGNMEGAMDALWVAQGALENGDGGREDDESLGLLGVSRDKRRQWGLSGRLAPDEVVLREWTEVRIDMADEDDGYGTMGRQNSSATLSTPSNPGVSTTSRIRVHLDGIRMSVAGLGYYVRYNGSWIGYQDEGVLSVDVGMGGVHEGLGMDIEIEVDSSTAQLDYVRGELDTAATLLIPAIIVEDLGNDEPANMDVLDAVARASPSNAAAVIDLDEANKKSEPLFRVVDVGMRVEGMKISIDESRHWVINKMLVQPFGGAVVGRMIGGMLEQQMRLGLEILAKGLGAIVEEAGRIGGKRQRLMILKGYEGTEDMMDVLGDWWAALLRKGPEVFGSEKEEEEEEGVERFSTTQLGLTKKGVVLSSTETTIRTEQPAASPGMTSGLMIGHEQMETVHLTMDGVGTVPWTRPVRPGEPPLPVRKVDAEEETVVAVGGGAQLFPGKGGPYDGRDEARTREDEGNDEGLVGLGMAGVKKGVEGAKRGFDIGVEAAGKMERFAEEVQKPGDRSEGWRSNVFDF